MLVADAIRRDLRSNLRGLKGYPRDQLATKVSGAMPNTFAAMSQPKLARPEWLIEKQKLAAEYADLSPLELKLLDSIIEEHLGQLCFWPVKYARLLLSRHLYIYMIQ